MSVRSSIGGICGFFALVGAASCGAPADSGSTLDNIETLGAVASEVTFSNQVTGFTNDSNPSTSTAAQSETNIAFSAVNLSDVREIVAYNDFTNPGGFFGLGGSELGWSWSSGGGTWTHRKLVAVTTSNWPIYSGDPSIAVSPTNKERIFITNLAVPKEKTMPLVFPTSIGGMIVAYSGDRGANFNFMAALRSTAANPNGDFYDGTSVAAGNNQQPINNFVVAATHDVDTNTADVWANYFNEFGFFKMASPFDSRFPVVIHPRVRIDLANRIFVAATVQFNGIDQLALNFTDPAGTWMTVPAITGGPIVPVATVTLSTAQLRSSPELSIAVGNEVFGCGPPGCGYRTELRAAYTYVNSLGRYHVGVSSWICTNTDTVNGQLQGGSCTDGFGGTNNGWTTESINADHWAPSIAYGNGTWKLAYYSRDDDPNGNQVSLYSVTVPARGTPNFANRTLLAAPQVPCVVAADGGGYWGDYNDIKYNSTDGSFYATYTQSTPGCSPTSPIGHVSQAAVH